MNKSPASTGPVKKEPNTKTFRHPEGRTVKDKKAERKVWADKHSQPSYRTRTLIKMYKMTDIPQHQWDLERARELHVIHPIHWTDSGSAIKDYYRSMVRIHGCSKYRTDKRARKIREALHLHQS